MKTKLTKAYVEKNLKKTETALESVELIDKKDEKSRKVFEMAQRYAKDSRFYLEKGELVSALGCLEYAHGLLDAIVGARFARVLKNPELFVFE